MRTILLALILVIAIALSVTALIGAAAEGRGNDSVSEQLSMCIHYLDEMEYVAAIVCFNQALSIDDKNVAAYLGTEQKRIESKNIAYLFFTLIYESL